MAPLLPRSALPPLPLRDGSLDQRQPLLSPALISRATPLHRDKDHSEDRCKEWKRRICRTCCFWRCKPDSRDYDQSPPSEPKLRRRDPPQLRNEAVLGRQTSTLRKRPNVPLKTGRTTGSGPQQPLATGSPTRKLSRPHGRLRSIGVDAASWMAALPDHVHLDTLYLPGTHQSLALNYPLASSLCQTTSLTAQLRGGIRCLDLRFSLIRDDQKGGKLRLWAYHGPVPQGREMGEVFQELYEWLGSEEGKQETVIVSIKQENSGHHEFAALVWEQIDSTRPYMWYDQNAWPTLGQVRGRCVMFCRFGFESGRGLHPPIWPNDKPYPWRTEIGGRATVVQDWYGVRSPLSIPDKANLALSLFDSSSAAFTRSQATTTASKPTLATATAATAHPAGMDSKADNEPPTVPFRINFLSCGTFPTLYPSHAAKGFGAPRFGIGYRGVNRLVLLGLERLDDAAAARTTSRGDGVQHLVVGAGNLQHALAPPPSEEEEKSPTTGGGDFGGRTLDRPQLAGGRQRREGQGGMMVLMDFWESPPPRKDSLVERIIEMNF